jgi:hypothetical protein
MLGKKKKETCQNFFLKKIKALSVYAESSKTVFFHHFWPGLAFVSCIN